MTSGVYKRTKQHGLNISKANKGRIHSPEMRKKISESHLRMVRDGTHPRWQGDNTSYEAFHMHIKKYHGKALICENVDCIYPKINKAKRITLKPKRFEWAYLYSHNRYGKYSRNIEDYVQLCCSCHRLFDLQRIKINIKNIKGDSIEYPQE